MLLPPMDDHGGAVVQIACDESGLSGRNLLDAATPVVTHASVDLQINQAAELIGVLKPGLARSESEISRDHSFARRARGRAGLTFVTRNR